MHQQQQPASKLSFLSNLPFATTILHSSYNAVAGTAGSIYSASSWLGGKVFGGFNTVINSEQKFNAEQAQRAKTNLPILEVQIAEKVRSAVTILATGTAFYYNPSLALGVFAALRLMPHSITQAAYKVVFNDNKQAIEQAVNAQDMITKGFSLYYGMLPASLIQAVVVGGVETALKKLNSHNTLPQSYINHKIGERLWLWSGTVASVYQDHRFVTNQQIYKNTVEQLQAQTGNVTRVNSFNCRLTVSGEECSIVQQSIAVQNQQTGDIFYATVNVDAEGIKTPVSLATVAANGVITNHSINDLPKFSKEINFLVACDSNIISPPTKHIAEIKDTIDLNQGLMQKSSEMRGAVILQGGGTLTATETSTPTATPTVTSTATVSSTVTSTETTETSTITVTPSATTASMTVTPTKTGATVAPIASSEKIQPVLMRKVGDYLSPTDSSSGGISKILLSSGGEFAYATQYYNSDKVLIFNISNPIKPVLVNEIIGIAFPYSITLLPSYPDLLAVHGNGYMSLYDISNIYNPSIIISRELDTKLANAQTITELPGHIDLLAVGGNVGIALVNISDINNAHIVGPVINVSYAYSITTFPHHPNLLAADRVNEGVSLVDISDIFNPSVVVTLEQKKGPTVLPDYPDLLAVYDGYWYYGGYQVALINISDVSNTNEIATIYAPSYISFMTTLPQHPKLLVLVHEYEGISLVDISNIFNPLIVKFNIAGGALSITTLPNHPNLVMLAGNVSGISLIDINEISQPVLVATAQTAGVATSFLTLQNNDNLLLVSSEDGLTTLEINYKPIINEPYKDQSTGIRGSVRIGDYIKSIITVPNHPELLAVAANYFVSLVDISDIYKPVIVGSTKLEFLDSMLTLPNHPDLLIAADWSSTVSLINISDISNPTSILTGGAYSLTAIPHYPNMLAVSDGHNLVLINITDISNPLTTYLNIPGGAFSITALPNNIGLLAVTGSHGEVSLVNISNTSKLPLSTFNITGGARSITSSPGYSNWLAVASDSGVSLVDISDIENPSIKIVSTGAAYSITTLPNYPNLLAAASDRGVSLVDISDIFQPVLVATIAILNGASSITALPNYPNLLLVAHNYGGVSLIDISDITNSPIATVNTRSNVDLMTTLPNYPNLLAVYSFSQLSIIEFNRNSFALWTSSNLTSKKIGQGFSEQLSVYSDMPYELLKADKKTVTIQQIALDGTNPIDPPRWLSIERETLTLNGVPLKEATGMHFAVELNFNAAGTASGKKGNYKPLFRFDVVSSLNLNKTVANYTLPNLTTTSLPTLAIDAIASLVTMTLTASPIANIKFITTDDFGPIRPSFNPITGVFEAFGAPRVLNEMLKSLRYQPFTADATSTTSIAVHLDDAGLNYNVIETVSMSYFRENQLPVYSKPINDQSIDIRNTIDFIVPANAFTDADDKNLIYSAYNFTNGTERSLSVPSGWLTFVTDQRRFTGRFPGNDLNNTTIKIYASDGYMNASGLFSIIPILENESPRLTKKMDNRYAKVGKALNFFIPQNTFVDPESQVLQYSANVSLPWLEFQSISGIFFGIPDEKDVGITTVSLTAQDVYQAKVSTDFNISVDHTPILWAPLTVKVLEAGKQFGAEQIPPLTKNFIDIDGDNITYDAKFDNGLSLLDWPWLYFNSSNGQFYGTTPAGFRQTRSIQVIANDGKEGSTSAAFDLTVTPFPKININLTNVAKTTDKDWEYALPANLFSSDNQLTFEVQLDGQKLPSWLKFDADTMIFTGKARMTDAIEHTYFIDIIATDRFGAKAGTGFELTVQNTINQAPIVAQDIPTPQYADINKYRVIKIDKDTFVDPDGDTLVLSASNLPSWLKFDASTGNFSGTPKTTDTNSLEDRRTTIYLTANDGNNGIVKTQFDIIVTGDSLFKLIIKYAGTAFGVLGTIYGFYAYRVPIYNALLWRTYRHFHQQNNQVMENIILQVAKQADSNKYTWREESAIYRHQILHKLTQALVLENQAIEEETPEQRAAREQKVLEKTKEIEEAIKEIHEIKSFLVMDFPLDNRLQRIKASIKNFIPSAVNKLVAPLNNLTSRIKWLSEINFGMNKSLFHPTKQIEGGLPAWLKREQDTESESLYVVPIEKNTDVIIGKPIRIRLLKENGICIEEIGMQVVDAEALAASAQEVVDVSPSVNSTIAAVNGTTGGPIFPVRRLSVLHALKGGEVDGEEMDELLTPGAFTAAVLQDVTDEVPSNITRENQATAAFETREEILAASEVSPLPEMSSQPASGVLAEMSADLFPSPSAQQQTANPASTQDIFSAQAQSPLANSTRSVRGTAAPILPLFGQVRSKPKSTGGRQATTIVEKNSSGSN